MRRGCRNPDEVPQHRCLRLSSCAGVAALPSVRTAGCRAFHISPGHARSAVLLWDCSSVTEEPVSGDGIIGDHRNDSVDGKRNDQFGQEMRLVVQITHRKPIEIWLRHKQSFRLEA
jgi:hypothetical protein